MNEHIAFIGGGNMANAMIGGLIRAGVDKARIDVVEPLPEAREKLASQLGVTAHPQAGAFLGSASVFVWAVKPQALREAAFQVRAHSSKAMHLSIAAGIRSDSVARWVDTERVIRAMPNTPALIGKGITAMFARDAISAADKLVAEKIVASTGDFLWLDVETQLDAVTAISGSGPAYVFYFMEAMTQAGSEMGLTREQAYQLAVATFVGAGALAQASHEPPEILRHRVTSKGGTTHAAIAAMDASQVNAHFVQAMHAAQRRAQELGGRIRWRLAAHSHLQAMLQKSGLP